MITIVRTNSDNQEFRHLVTFLDADLRSKDGEAMHSFFSQFNKIDNIKHTVVARDAEIPVGCGAIKEYADGIAEVKRMFVLPEYRGKGIARQILSELEKWATELGYSACILETGKKMTDALRLYQHSGYIITANYGQYIGIEDSVCMSKKL